LIRLLVGDRKGKSMKQYFKAITREPGINFADGITSADTGSPDFEKAVEQHHSYCEALRACGIEVTLLEADRQYPDGCFVEDTAVIAEDLAVITRPGDPSRKGEVKQIARLLSSFKQIETIKAPGTLDGGDVMRVGSHFYIGLSGRTNKEGADQLSSLLERCGFTSSLIPVTRVLHLKTGITFIGKDTYITVAEFEPFFSGSNIICLAPEERYAANTLLINGRLLIPKGYPKVREKIAASGYDTVEVEMSEFRKMDGGLTCLSLLF
jgi:dimethylargininase